MFFKKLKKENNKKRGKKTERKKQKNKMQKKEMVFINFLQLLRDFTFQNKINKIYHLN